MNSTKWKVTYLNFNELRAILVDASDLYTLPNVLAGFGVDVYNVVEIKRVIPVINEQEQSHPYLK